MSSVIALGSLVSRDQIEHSWRMRPRTLQAHPALLALLAILAWGTLLGLAYGQSPLPTSNQNQYYLHGYARAGIGNLDQDWLAGTRDPTPVFTLLAEVTARTFPAALNHVFFLILFAFYLVSLYSIADYLFGLSRSKTASLLFLAAMFGLHSAALRAGLSALPASAGEWAYLFDGGLGGQRLLGPVLQPSVFGVLLLVSVWRFLEDDHLTAILATIFAAWMHPTYLLSGATLTVAYLIAMYRKSRDLKEPLKLVVLGMALVLPVVVYVYLAFLPPSAQAQEILVDFRIPDHAIPAEWFDLTAVFKIAWIAAATGLLWRTRLKNVMLISIGVAAGLTVLQVITDSDTLALLFPWRISAYLVPLATAALVSKAAVLATERNLPRRALQAISLIGIGLSIASGLVWSTIQFVDRERLPERAMFSFVRQNQSPGELYLVPPKMQDFRLATGAPILADFKSIPYRSGEVLEWYGRIRMMEWFYRKQVAEIDCGLLETFADEYGVTHVVLGPDQHELACPGLEPLYDDGAYVVHALFRE
jgi:hypothetical protein